MAKRFIGGLCSKGLTLDKTFKYILRIKPRDLWDGNEDLDANDVFRSVVHTSLKRNKHICLSKEAIKKQLKISE